MNFTARRKPFNYGACYKFWLERYLKPGKCPVTGFSGAIRLIRWSPH
jgi:hypothetical protein